MEEYLIRSQGKALAMFSILPDQFYLMEVGEINTALEAHEHQERVRKEEWRLTSYILARPHFDPKKQVPTIEQFHPFPWDKNKKDPVRFIPYDEQIEFAIKKGRKEWIPNHWFEQSENYKHLSNGTAGIQHGSKGNERAAKSAQANARKDQKKRALPDPEKRLGPDGEGHAG